MEQTIIGTIGIVMVCFALLLIFVAGLVYITKQVRSWNQASTKRYITSDEAAQIKEQNTSIHAQLKQLNSKS